MKSIFSRSRRRGVAITLCAIAMTLASCGFITDFSDFDGPDDERGTKDKKTGTITVQVSPGRARTVVPDAILAAKSYAVSWENRVNPALSGSASGLIGPTITVKDVYPGTMTITVMAYSDAAEQNASTLVASGTSSVFTLAGGATVPIEVTLGMNQTSRTGSFSLDLAWPVSTGADQLVALIIDSADNPVEEIRRDGIPGTTEYSANVSPTRALTSGTYRLQITFNNPDPTVHRVGAFCETINIYDGLTSTLWIDPEGNLVTTRTFTEVDFASGDTGVRLMAMFDPESYVNLDFSPTGTIMHDFGVIDQWYLNIKPESIIPGQYISARLNGANPIRLIPDEVSAIRLSGGNNVLEINVRAPDATTNSTYFIEARIPQTQIRTEEELRRITANGVYLLMNTINLTSAWDYPVYNFSGEFDGGGHSITGLVITSTYLGNLSLFPYNTGMIKNLIVSDAVVTSTATVNEANFGILVGTNQGTIYRCATSGTITNGAQWRIGGLAGNNNYPGQIHECYTSVNIITANSWYAGGLVGTNKSVVMDSYARGNISGQDTCGGLAGLNESANATVNRCYSTGTVTYTNAAAVNGGCTGNTEAGAQIEVSFYDADTSGTPSGGVHGVGLDTDTMKSIANYTAAGWNFDTVWGIDPTGIINEGYPYLRYFNELDPPVILVPPDPAP